MSHDFEKSFGREPEWQGFTPGRVNLIGEHVDYNGGRVLPTALHLGVSVSLASRTDSKIRIKASDFDGLEERDLSETAKDHWSDYVLGAMHIAKSKSLIERGADIAITSTLPMGAGLSSSAAITVCLLTACRDLAGANLSPREIAVLAREIETDFIGVPVGIMDQMAVAVASPGQALSLDTQDLSYSLIDLPENEHMAVIHSGVHRQLSEGRYKTRKEECDAVKRAAGRDDICRMSLAELEKLSALSDAEMRRGRHVISEHQRVIKAGEALRQKDMTRFGALMNESHLSMRDDFEMSVPAIDALVETAQSLGAKGARLTGGGFGGCIVACIDKSELEVWKTKLLRQHPSAFWVC